MISRKQLSKNLYKLTKKEFPEIFGDETDDDDTEVDSLGWWSSIDEASEYCDSGENKRLKYRNFRLNKYFNGIAFLIRL